MTQEKHTHRKTIRAALKIISAAAMLAVAGVSGAAKADPSVLAITHDFGNLKEAAYADGYRLISGPLMQRIQQNGSWTYTLSLEAGVDYAIVGLCDRDCNAISLRLHDENRHLISVHNEFAARGMVKVTPRWTGSFTLTVGMTDCDARQCATGIAVFGR